MRTREAIGNGIEPVLVDSCIWGMALRKQQRTPSQLDHVAALSSLVLDGRVQIIGPVKQEVLSGISDPSQYNRLLEALRPFPNIPLLDEDFERAAELSNQCRRRGFQGGATDFLLCIVAARCELLIYTVDRDFQRYMAVFPEFDLYITGSGHWG